MTKEEQEVAEARAWTERFEAYKKEMSEKWGESLAEFKTAMLPEPMFYLNVGSLCSFTTEQMEQDLSAEVRRGQEALLAYGVHPFLKPYEGEVMILRSSDLVEENPGLHLTRAESHESSLRMRDYFDEHTTEEFFDMWMTREGVS